MRGECEMEGGNGGEKGGREGEGFHHLDTRAITQGCIKPSRMCTCVLYNDSCCPILLKVPTLWGSFEIKNVRLAKIMLRQLSG